MGWTTMQTIPNQRYDVAKLYLLTKPAIFEIFLSHESSNLNSSRMKSKQVNYRKTIKINNYEHIWHTNKWLIIVVYMEWFAGLKGMIHEKNCHPKITILGQNWPEIHIFQLIGVKYQILTDTIIIYRQIHPRNDWLPNVPCLFSPLNIFFTLLALKPGSDLEPCRKYTIGCAKK